MEKVFKIIYRLQFTVSGWSELLVAKSDSMSGRYDQSIVWRHEAHVS